MNVYLGKITEQKLSFLLATLLLDLIYAPNKIIKLSLRVWEFWPAQAFGIRGDNYVMEKVRVPLNTTCLY